MTRREYFHANRKVILSLFKILGVAATSVFAILFLVTSFRFSAMTDAFYLFLVCFVLGNLIAFSFTYLSFSTQYSSYRDQLTIFNSLDPTTKDEFKIVLYTHEPKHKFGLAKVSVYGHVLESFFEIRSDRSEKKIRVILFEKLEEVDFEKAYRLINEKYSDDSISLTGSGLVKQIRLSQWKNINSIDFRAVFLELYRVLKEEKLQERMPGHSGN